MNLFDYLKNNTYPGRGIFAGYYQGEKVLAYFIMGRSANSRNRVFKMKDGILYTDAYDPSRVADPSLIIYNAMRPYEGRIILTNGNQTDTVYDFLKDGKTFEEALATREYEPDHPNYTPRISVLLEEDSYTMSILKKEGEECKREYYSYPYEEGKGHFLSTYDHDGNPLPSFSKEPLEADIDMNFEGFAEELWKSLDQDNKISLYVRFGNKEKIFNRNGE